MSPSSSGLPDPSPHLQIFILEGDSLGCRGNFLVILSQMGQYFYVSARGCNAAQIQCVRDNKGHLSVPEGSWAITSNAQGIVQCQDLT